jgi:transcriptional regulator with XRE-family HTH domain
MDLSRRVRELRYAKGWGPEELAKRAKISRDTLYHIERGGTHKPQRRTLQRIAQALGVSLEALLEEMPVSSKALPTDVTEATGILPVSTRPAELAVLSNRAEILMAKFRLHLASPFADGIALIVEESLRLLTNLRPAMLQEAPDDPSHSDCDPGRSIPLGSRLAPLGCGDQAPGWLGGA